MSSITYTREIIAPCWLSSDFDYTMTNTQIFATVQMAEVFHVNPDFANRGSMVCEDLCVWFALIVVRKA